VDPFVFSTVDLAALDAFKSDEQRELTDNRLAAVYTLRTVAVYITTSVQLILTHVPPITHTADTHSQHFDHQG
jgi:regulator of extracellular matrix RemA (YlzA/DUF370 family)